jgi:hypothetical protein
MIGTSVTLSQPIGQISNRCFLISYDVVAKSSFLGSPDAFTSSRVLLVGSCKAASSGYCPASSMGGVMPIDQLMKSQQAWIFIIMGQLYFLKQIFNFLRKRNSDMEDLLPEWGFREKVRDEAHSQPCSTQDLEI